MRVTQLPVPRKQRQQVGRELEKTHVYQRSKGNVEKLIPLGELLTPLEKQLIGVIFCFAQSK
jgi:hypothetical protein